MTDYNAAVKSNATYGMTNNQMLREFHTVMGLPLDQSRMDKGAFDSLELAYSLIQEEFIEFSEAEDNESVGEDVKEHVLKELADLVYVCYGYAVRRGWNLDKAIKRVHMSNMSKLDDNGEPVRREDGKVLKGPNYKLPDLGDLV